MPHASDMLMGTDKSHSSNTSTWSLSMCVNSTRTMRIHSVLLHSRGPNSVLRYSYVSFARSATIYAQTVCSAIYIQKHACTLSMKSTSILKVHRVLKNRTRCIHFSISKSNAGISCFVSALSSITSKRYTRRPPGLRVLFNQP